MHVHSEVSSVHSASFVCIQSVCDITELEKWGGYAPPASKVGGAVAPLASLSPMLLQLSVLRGAFKSLSGEQLIHTGVYMPAHVGYSLVYTHE